MIRINNKSLYDYYFVSLGKVKGGYHELLGLSISATDVDARKAEGKYKNNLEADFKGKRKILKEQLNNKEITYEEFESKLKVIETNNTTDLANLNKLKEEFTAKIAAQRLQGGFSDDQPEWLLMYKSILDFLDFKQLIFQSIPLNANKNEHILLETQFGYHELLGLSKAATEVDTRKAEENYKKYLEFNFRGKQKILKEQLNNKEITTEEFRIKLKKNKTNYTDDLRNLYKLRNEFVDRIAALRTISSIKQITISIQDYIKKKPKTLLGDKSFQYILELIDQCKFLVLRTNDNFIEKSNPLFAWDSWKLKINKWALYYKEHPSHVKLGFEYSQGLIKEKILFPNLNRPFSIQLRELKEQEIADYSKTPERSGDVLPFEEIMAKFLKLIVDEKLLLNEDGN